MIEDRPDILAAASTDWDGFWFQRQVIASGFARRGHRVFYFNRTLQRRPRFRHFKRRFLKSSKRETLKNPRPDNLRTITPIRLPPPRRWLPADPEQSRQQDAASLVALSAALAKHTPC